MPELPEVEIMVRQLRSRLAGRTIRRVEVRDPKIRLNGSLTGCQIRAIRRRAKFIIFDLTKERHLVVHLRMTGWFVFAPPPKYRLAIHGGNTAAYFEDSRRFGVVEVLTRDELVSRLKHLGPEPLAPGFDLAGLRRTTRPVKMALLDQELVAGIGNIYASESLWRAGINPRRRADGLKLDELRRLRRGIIVALRKGIGYGPRIFQIQRFAVYDRTGKPCRRCGVAVKRIVQAQRSTFYCPACQA